MQQIIDIACDSDEVGCENPPDPVVSLSSCTADGHRGRL